MKDYLLKGYVVNQKRLEYLEKTIKIIDIANRLDEKIENNEAREILKVIGNYSKYFNLLDNYDHKIIKKIKGSNNQRIKYSDCINIIDKLKKDQTSSIFVLER